MNKRLFDLVVRTYELKGAAYQVMLVLAWNAGATDECSISISDLASAAHLTKQSVVRALHSLTAPDATAEGRSILTRARRGRGTGISTTYLINPDLMRDLNRRRRYRLATECHGPDAGEKLMPGVAPANDGKTGNLEALVEHPLTRTFTGEIRPNVITTSGFSISPTSKPLTQREINKVRKEQVKHTVREMFAILNADEDNGGIKEELLGASREADRFPKHGETSGGAIGWARLEPESEAKFSGRHDNGGEGKVNAAALHHGSPIREPAQIPTTTPNPVRILWPRR